MRITRGGLLKSSDAAGAYPSQVNHGSTAGTARTAGATVVEWYGSVAPTNAASGDRWWDTTTELWKRYTGSAWVAAGSSTYAPTSLTPRVDALEVATAPAGVKTAKSYVVIDKAATANSYNFPARLRPLESTRRDLRVRNNGTTTVQLGYAALSQANSNYNGPASWTVTLAPGAEYPEPPGMSGALYIRPNTSGQGLRVGVYCEIGVL